MVEIHWWYLFHLGTWGRKIKDLFKTLYEIHPSVQYIYCRMITKVKRTDSHQYLHSSPFHPYRCKKSILIVKHCILIKSVLKMTFFYIHCNSLEKWPTDRGKSEKLVRKGIFIARDLSIKTHYALSNFQKKFGKF